MSSKKIDWGHNPCVCSITPFYDDDIPAYIWNVLMSNLNTHTHTYTRLCNVHNYTMCNTHMMSNLNTHTHMHIYVYSAYFIWIHVIYIIHKLDVYNIEWKNNVN